MSLLVVAVEMVGAVLIVALVTIVVGFVAVAGMVVTPPTQIWQLSCWGYYENRNQAHL